MNRLQLNARVRLEGILCLKVYRPNGELRVYTGEFKNLILDNGLNRMGVGSFMSHCQVGSGSVPPANTDTALVTFVGSSSTIHSSSQGANASTPYYGWTRRTWRFGVGVATGNLTEVGIGWSGTSGNLFSRALIKDELGDPTTITVLSDEVLDVTYELRSYPDPVDTASAAVEISGDSPLSLTCVTRPTRVTDYWYWAPQDGRVSNKSWITHTIAGFTGTMGAITALPNGTSGSVSGVSMADYGNNDLFNDFTMTWELDYGNVAGGIKSISFASTIGAWQAEFSAVILKTNTKVLRITVRVSWARYVP